MIDIKTNPFVSGSTETILALALLAMSFAAVGANSASNPINGTINTSTLPPVDLVDERPSAAGAVWNYSTQAVGWVWNGFYNNVLYWVSPPSPTNLLNSVSKDDAIKLFKLLNYAGYKLKLIDTDVGIIPGIKVKFGQVRELSDADLEYLDNQLEEWTQKSPGMYDGLQRNIIKTVMAINTSGAYEVSSLEIKLLPLPDVAFSMTPKQRFLGEEASTLMRAIQRVERGIRNLKEEPGNTKQVVAK